MKSSGPGVSVVTATYNERENIQLLVENVRESLKGLDHEIVIVDDSSPDGTYLEARRLADKALLMRKAGQTKSLLIGIKSSKYPTVVTLDADLENPPELIPYMLKTFQEKKLDLLIASRTRLPRISKRFASRTIGRIIGIRDVYSNFRVYRRDLFKDYKPILGETFGGELLAYAWIKGFKLGEQLYDPPPRRAKPRIGGSVRVNARILAATAKLLIYLTFSQ